MSTVNEDLDELAAGLRRKVSLTRLFSTESGGAGQSLARHSGEDPAGAGGGSQPARRHSHAEVSQPAAEASRPAAEGHQGEAGLLA